MRPLTPMNTPRKERTRLLGAYWGQPFPHAFPSHFSSVFKVGVIPVF